MATRDADGAAALFARDGTWRDIISFTWHLHTFNGRNQIRVSFQDTMDETGPSCFELRTSPAPRWVTRAGTDAVEALFDFRTEVGTGAGVFRIAPNEDGRFLANTLMTSLVELTGHEETVGERRPDGRSTPGNSAVTTGSTNVSPRPGTRPPTRRCWWSAGAGRPGSGRTLAATRCRHLDRRQDAANRRQLA